MQTEHWTLTIHTPVGPQHGIVHLRQAAGGWEGEAIGGGQRLPLRTIVREGNRMTWTQHLLGPLRFPMRFDVTIIDDQLSGSARAGWLPPSHVSGKRLP